MTVEVEVVYMGVFIASHSSLDPRACWARICFFMLRLKDLGVKRCILYFSFVFSCTLLQISL